MPLLSRSYILCRRSTWHRLVLCTNFQSTIAAKFTTCRSSKAPDHEKMPNMPYLRAVRNDASVEDISEEDFYKYARHRWIYNEGPHLSERYLKFDLKELLRVAVATVAVEGAHYCTEVLKCTEGLNNKAFLLTMDNGSEVLAKLPNPCAGPAFYTTASEVATRQFLRDVLGIPVPRILTWSSDRNNPVGAEYILEEKAQGKPLANLWQDWDEWPLESRYNIIDQVVEIERKLASMKFTKSGCIYFRGDFPHGDSLVATPPLSSTVLQRFTLGPLVENGMWRGAKASLKMNRGPYNDPLELIEARAKGEMEFIKDFARPRMNYARSITELEQPKDMLDLLNQYLRLVPAMVPPPVAEDIHSSTLWHPDFHLNNVFIDPKSKKITNIIDWQGAAALPIFYQCGVPKMFRHRGVVSNDLMVWPKRPDNYGSLEQQEKEEVDNLIKSECLHKCYLAITHRKNPRHWAALHSQDEQRLQPIRIVLSVWDNFDVFFLRRALIRIVKRWEDLSQNAGPCPVTFNDQEMALHLHEEENKDTVSEVLGIFQKNWGLSPDGLVETTEFAKMQTELARMKDAFIAASDNEEDRFLAQKLWPYQNTPVA